MRKIIALLLCVFSLQGEEISCSKELLLSYFPKPFVLDTLKRFDVPQDQWTAITNELAAKEEDVIPTVEGIATKMDPDPLQDPEKREQVVKIFRETLLKIFSGVMYAHGVTDDNKLQMMLDDIQRQKAKRFIECMKSEKIKPHAPPTRNNSDALID